jgi:hypothetical protein
MEAKVRNWTEELCKKKRKKFDRVVRLYFCTRSIPCPFGTEEPLYIKYYY